MPRPTAIPDLQLLHRAAPSRHRHAAAISRPRLPACGGDVARRDLELSGRQRHIEQPDHANAAAPPLVAPAMVCACLYAPVCTGGAHACVRGVPSSPADGMQRQRRLERPEAERCTFLKKKLEAPSPSARCCCPKTGLRNVSCRCSIMRAGPSGGAWDLLQPSWLRPWRLVVCYCLLFCSFGRFLTKRNEL